ncbi:twin-arginine translocation signal domain-containing protein, partial [Xylella fastidiosa subsp. multiplex]|nr:twin-arginine translocation signal domain-containing protein [Xylella fastidiosa subsp. multiplex]
RAPRPPPGGCAGTRRSRAAAHERALQGRNFGRRAFLGAAVSAAAVAGVAVVAYPQSGLWPAAGEGTADERTAVGEQR